KAAEPGVLADRIRYWFTALRCDAARGEQAGNVGRDTRTRIAGNRQLIDTAGRGCVSGDAGGGHGVIEVHPVDLQFAGAGCRGWKCIADGAAALDRALACLEIAEVAALDDRFGDIGGFAEGRRPEVAAPGSFDGEVVNRRPVERDFRIA